MKRHIKSGETLDDREPPMSRHLVWLGNSRKNVRAFPIHAKKRVGDELGLIQFGGMPKDAKPFKGVGSGVFEISVRHDTNAYRTVLAARLGRKIHILHAFGGKGKVETGNSSAGHRTDQTPIQGSKGTGKP